MAYYYYYYYSITSGSRISNIYIYFLKRDLHITRIIAFKALLLNAMNVCICANGQ